MLLSLQWGSRPGDRQRSHSPGNKCVSHTSWTSTLLRVLPATNTSTSSHPPTPPRPPDHEHKVLLGHELLPGRKNEQEERRFQPSCDCFSPELTEKWWDWNAFPSSQLKHGLETALMRKDSTCLHVWHGAQVSCLHCSVGRLQKMTHEQISWDKPDSISHAALNAEAWGKSHLDGTQQWSREAGAWPLAFGIKRENLM